MVEISKVKEFSFLKSDLTDPPSDFWCASFGKYRFKAFQISFFSDFYIKIMFWVRWFYSLFERMRLKRKKLFIHTNQPLITSFYIKKIPIFSDLAMSQRWFAIFCATAAWAGKPIGRVRVKVFLHQKISSKFSIWAWIWSFQLCSSGLIVSAFLKSSSGLPVSDSSKIEIILRFPKNSVSQWAYVA